MPAIDTCWGVKGVVLKDDEFLVLLDSNGEDDLPGGRLEANESFWDGLRREIFEETGIREVVITESSVYWCFRKGRNRLIKGTTWLCHFQGCLISLSIEHSGYTWKPLEQIQSLGIYQKYGLDKFGFDFMKISSERREAYGIPSYRDAVGNGGRRGKRRSV